MAGSSPGSITGSITGSIAGSIAGSIIGVRPVLRPGLRLADTPFGMLLVDATTAVPATDRVVALIRRLDGLHDVESLGDPDAAALAWLFGRGLVVDLADHERRIAQVAPGQAAAAPVVGDPRDGDPGVSDPPGGTPPGGTPPGGSPPGATPTGGPPAGVAALLNHPDADLRWRARRRTRLRIHGTGHTARRVIELLADAGVARLDLPDGMTPPQAPGTRFTHQREGDADLELLLHDHEPPLELLESCGRDDRPHLIAGLRHPVAVVGPLVVPGWSACHRCADLAHGDTDPRWPYLRAALASSPVGAIGTPPPDPVQASTLAALTVAEVLAFVESRPPRTLNAVLRIDQDGWPQLHPLRPHPRCGCGWPGASHAPAELP